jgi:hypothetical protein
VPVGVARCAGVYELLGAGGGDLLPTASDTSSAAAAMVDDAVHGDAASAADLYPLGPRCGAVAVPAISVDTTLDLSCVVDGVDGVLAGDLEAGRHLCAADATSEPGSESAMSAGDAAGVHGDCECVAGGDGGVGVGDVWDSAPLSFTMWLPNKSPSVRQLSAIK